MYIFAIKHGYHTIKWIAVKVRDLFFNEFIIMPLVRSQIQIMVRQFAQYHFLIA